MGFKTFTCNICGKENLTKRNSYVNGSGRACREHEEVKPPTPQGDAFNKAYFDIEIDPRCPEVGYAHRILLCMNNSNSVITERATTLALMALNSLHELLNSPQHQRFAVVVLPPREYTAANEALYIEEYKNTLSILMECALYGEEEINKWIQDEVIPLFSKLFEDPASAERIPKLEFVKVLRPIRMAKDYDPEGKHKPIANLMTALSTYGPEVYRIITSALQELEKQGFVI